MSFLKHLFHKEPPLDERVKEWRKGLRSEMRSVDREVRQLERMENKIKADVKQLAKRGEVGPAKTLARELVRSKKAKERMYQTKAQLNSVILELNQQLAMVKMSKAIQMSGQAMQHMNALVKVKDLSRNVMVMGREMEKAGFIQEMMDDTMSSLDDEDLDAEADEEVQRVFDELTVGVLSSADAAPQSIAQHQQQQEEQHAREQALELPSVPT